VEIFLLCDLLLLKSRVFNCNFARLQINTFSHEENLDFSFLDSVVHLRNGSRHTKINRSSNKGLAQAAVPTLYSMLSS
jgi:hypothetical protein